MTFAHLSSSDQDNVELMTNTTVVSLLTDDSPDGKKSVSGVRILNNGKEEDVFVAGVVLTAGGYAFDRSKGSLLEQFAPEKLHLPTTRYGV